MPADIETRRAQPHLGTFVEIVVDGRRSHDVDRAIDAGFAAIARVHRLMSFHDPASDVSRINREAATRAVRVDAWTFSVLRAAGEFHRRSCGLFDVGVAPTLQRLALLPSDGMRNRPAPSEGFAAVELLSDRRVRFHSPKVRIDLGGIAKGFAVDRAVAALRRRGIGSGLVNAGGDLRAFGEMRRIVGVRHPTAPRRLLCRVGLRNGAIASSAASAAGRSVARSAVIDPRTAKVARAIRAASVRAASCMTADALTKIVIIGGADSVALLRRYRASALFVTARGVIRATADWSAELSAAA
jgi:thiamine biosynthesis lipoprotein